MKGKKLFLVFKCNSHSWFIHHTVFSSALHIFFHIRCCVLKYFTELNKRSNHPPPKLKRRIKRDERVSNLEIEKGPYSAKATALVNPLGTQSPLDFTGVLVVHPCGLLCISGA